MASDEERARAKELLAEWNRWAACQPLEDDSAAKEDAEFVRMMAEALTAAREAALREAWVPVSERLPDGRPRQILLWVRGKPDGYYVHEQWKPGWVFPNYVSHWREDIEPPPPPTKGTP